MNKGAGLDFQVDKQNNMIRIGRLFDAPLDLVWAAWSEPDILDQWWAPKPYRTETRTLNFKEGGTWLYAMIGPDESRLWCKADYKSIKPMEVISWLDAFCDERGVENSGKPRSLWINNFAEKGDSTMVSITLQHENLADIEWMIQMGFKDGFAAALGNLDQYISSQFYLRKQKKTHNRARVSTYVNFPGNAEEAFHFYKSVFKTDFIKGMQRFGELPDSPGQPPLPDHVKNLVLHIELPLLGDHVLMGTDAPKEMGFTVTRGNNMHINLEPDSRSEADRLFNELSKGGKIEMPMQDMFWGAYFGSFTDRFGINWIVNHLKK